MIAKVVDGARGRANREDTNGNIYLPISMGYRNCYYRYMESLGFKVTVGPNGTLTAEGVEGFEDTFVSLSTYYTKWKTDYPNLKVSRPAEDICYYCYTFANKHRMLSNVAINEDTIISDTDDVDDGNNLDMESTVNLINNTTLDKLDSASTKVDEAKELLILECSKHIDMARA